MVIQRAGGIVELIEEIGERLAVVQGQVDGQLQPGRTIQAAQRLRAGNAGPEVAGQERSWSRLRRRAKDGKQKNGCRNSESLCTYICQKHRLQDSREPVAAQSQRSGPAKPQIQCERREDSRVRAASFDQTFRLGKLANPQTQRFAFRMFWQIAPRITLWAGFRVQKIHQQHCIGRNGI